MHRRSSTLQMLGFTIVLLFAVVLLLMGLGVFGVPDANDFRDWDSYYEKQDALWAERDKLFWESNKLHQESNKLHQEIEPFISRDFDNPNSFIETPEERAAKKVLVDKLKAQRSKFKALQRKSDKLQKKADKLDRQYPPELVSKYAGYPRY
jgi:cell division protein FtsB